jgi:hypothetical protein
MPIPDAYILSMPEWQTSVRAIMRLEFSDLQLLMRVNEDGFPDSFPAQEKASHRLKYFCSQSVLTNSSSP